MAWPAWMCASNRNKLGIVLGVLLLLGGFVLIFHPKQIAGHIVPAWELHYGALGQLLGLLGVLLVFRRLPPAYRVRALALYLVCCGVVFVLGFSCNWFYIWLQSGGIPSYDDGLGPPFFVWWVVLAFLSAVVGGFLLGRSGVLGRGWRSVLLALVICLVLFALAFSTRPGYYSYYYGDTGTYYFHDFAGDYMLEGLVILLVQFCILSGLFISFTVGFVTKRMEGLRG